MITVSLLRKKLDQKEFSSVELTKEYLMKMNTLVLSTLFARRKL